MVNFGEEPDLSKCSVNRRLPSGGGGGVLGVHKAGGGVAGRALGGAMGYSSGRKSSSLKMPSVGGAEGRGGVSIGAGEPRSGTTRECAGSRRTLIRR